jgi:cytochrome c oxidase subunit II
VAGRRSTAALGFCIGLASGACDGVQSALDPAGPQAARIERLWWFLLIVSTAVFLLVLAATAAAVLRRRRPIVAPEVEIHRERRLHTAILVATIATAATLFVFLIVNFSTERALASLPNDRPLTIEITGTQWWWRVRYVDSVSSRSLTTANEVHIPVGTPIKFELTSNDVIHSLWVPRLHGKRDLIPGRRSVTWLRADSAGVYRGQCAEFCGHQHALMGLTVIAEPRARFDAWLDHQLEPAAEPTTDEERRGRDVFMSASCAMCHTIRGTDAGAGTGPDLTHLASRGTIAAATLPNTRGHLGGWIVDPQSIKPGVKMPSNGLQAADLQALLSYLESLR